VRSRLLRLLFGASILATLAVPVVGPSAASADTVARIVKDGQPITR
jgi:hypothetical protein